MKALCYKGFVRRSLKILGLFAGILIMGNISGCNSKKELPNIVIILVDDMGYGDPGCYNPRSKIPTPNIDLIAGEGMRFTDAHASGPLCHLSRYGLMTGQYPFRTDVSVWRREPTIKENQITVASLLKSTGYHTAMVGKWHLGFHENGYENPLPGGPVDRGFDSYFGIRASTDIPPYFYIKDNHAVVPPTDQIEASSSEGWSPIQGRFWRAGGIAPGLELRDVLPRFTKEAIEIIQDHQGNDAFKNQPLMLYLAYPAPHTPWLPSPEFDGKSGAGMYGDFLMMVDAQIGMVLDALDQAGMSDNTLLIFSSDNGPVWYDVDVERFGHDASGGLRGMKADAWEAGHRMPFIVRWPGKVEKGSVSHQTICFTDVMATLADVTASDLPEGAGPDSYSFLPVLTGEQPEDRAIRPPVVMQSGSGSMMIRSGDWKLIDQLGSGGFSKPSYIEPGPDDPAGQLYNLADDPGETSNIYQDNPEIVARLTAEMRDITAIERKKVVYVNSYHAGHPPSDEVTAGVIETLPADSFQVYSYFMDSKRNSSKEFIELRAAELFDSITEIKPDILIVSDDNAVKYLVKPYINDESLPVVFCGVNWSADQYELNSNHITGIIEVLPVADLLSTIKSYYPSMNSLLVLNENTTTSRKTRPILDTLCANMGFSVTQELVDDFSSWKSLFIDANRTFDLIYLQTMGGIKNWDHDEALEVIEKNIKIPLVTCEDFMMPYSVFGLTQVSREQGEWAAEAAKKILSGTSPADIPVSRNQLSRIWINKALAEKIKFEPDSSLIRKANIVEY